MSGTTICKKETVNSDMQKSCQKHQFATKQNHNLEQQFAKKKDCLKDNNLQFQNHYLEQQQHGRSFSGKIFFWGPLPR